MTQGLLAVAVYQGMFWVAVLLMLVASHFMHGILIGFHEASHGHLRKSRFLNEADGVLIGVMSFMSFSLYRAAHQTHHAHLGTERDEELWPFVHPSAPRWTRILAAAAELCVGMIFTPALFFRIFVRNGSPIRSRKVRRRIWAEYALIAVVWTGIISTVAWLDGWLYFIWLYVLPGFIAANLQSWRKYIEHVGLTGSTIKSATRSIVSNSWPGRVVALTLLHEPFHGVHHQHVRLPHAELPERAAELEPSTASERGPFPSYWHALKDLWHSLADPRVGAQWRRETSLRD